VRAWRSKRPDYVGRDEFARANSSLPTRSLIELMSPGPHPQPFSQGEKGDYWAKPLRLVTPSAPKKGCAESNLLEQLSIYFRRMTGKLTNAGTRPLPGVLGKRSDETKSLGG